MALFTFKTEASTPECICDARKFPLASPSSELFDTSARELANEIDKAEVLIQREEWSERERRKVKVWKVQSAKDANKPSQLRKFYDEVCMWSEKARTVEDFNRHLPFIKMMNAKVAYARGRELVDDKFVAWFSSCLAQIKTIDETGLAVFQNFRTLFEAFMGFYKVVRPK